MKGSYFLLIYNKKTAHVKFGKKHMNKFPQGFYIYVGSAMGESNTSIRHRLTRYIKIADNTQSENFHWHIDYFLRSPLTSIKMIMILPNSVVKEECSLSELIQEYSDDNINGFGCSDCKCKSHLYYFNPENSFILSIMNCKLRN
jgi:Uri superfamily endonuclease